MPEKSVLDRFIKANPLTVMTRCIVGALMGDELNNVFEQNDDTIKFSTIATTASFRFWQRSPLGVASLSSVSMAV